MFAKLLKHDWRATSGTLWLLTAAAFGVSLLGGLVLHLLTHYEESLNPLVQAGLTLSMVFIGLALIAYGAAVEILQLVRFYKSRFTDEGYLTFTLPVKSHQVFLSTFLCMLLWTVITALVLTLCIAIILAIGLPWSEIMADLSGGSWSEFSFVWEELKEMYGFAAEPAYIVIQSLQVVVGVLYSIVMVLTCLTVGAVVAKKHKIIAAFVAYYAISFATSTVASIMSVATSISNMDSLLSSTLLSTSDMLYQAAIRGMSLSIAWEIVLIVAGYILSTQLMKKKLNLP